MNSPSLRAVATVLATAAAVVAAVTLAEAVYIGILASPAQVAAYHFGSESMIGHGGAAYASASSYLRHQLQTGSLATALAAVAGLLSSRATRSTGQLQPTWALRLPGYAWLFGGALLFGLGVVAAFDPIVIVEGETRAFARVLFFRQAGLWIALGLAAGTISVWCFRNYSRVRKAAG